MAIYRIKEEAMSQDLHKAILKLERQARQADYRSDIPTAKKRWQEADDLRTLWIKKESQ